MYLVIAEKPSVSKAIAEVIGASKKEEGYLEGEDSLSVGVLAILQNMFHRILMMKGLPDGCMRIITIIPEEWKLAVSKDKKNSSIFWKKLLEPPGYRVCGKCL